MINWNKWRLLMIGLPIIATVIYTINIIYIMGHWATHKQEYRLAGGWPTIDELIYSLDTPKGVFRGLTIVQHILLLSATGIGVFEQKEKYGYPRWTKLNVAAAALGIIFSIVNSVGSIGAAFTTPTKAPESHLGFALIQVCCGLCILPLCGFLKAFAEMRDNAETNKGLVTHMVRLLFVMVSIHLVAITGFFGAQSYKDTTASLQWSLAILSVFSMAFQAWEMVPPPTVLEKSESRTGSLNAVSVLGFIGDWLEGMVRFSAPDLHEPWDGDGQSRRHNQRTYP